jgi:hypothetical protein
MASSPSPLRPDDLLSARAAADRFLQAVVRGDEAEARALLIVREGEKIDFKGMHDSTAGYELGPATAEGETAVVVATIRAAPGKEGPPALPLVLARPDGAWRIDMAASVQRLLGGLDLEQLMRQMAEGVAQTMSHAMEGVSEAISSAFSADATAAPDPALPGASAEDEESGPPPRGRPPT